MLSPRSRGKGNRRVPWRDGGRGKQKAIPWRTLVETAGGRIRAVAGDVRLLKVTEPADLALVEALLA